MNVVPVSKPSRSGGVSPPGSVRALFAKGFRPFFLLASAFSAISTPIWLLALAGHADPGAYAGASSWHAHEMVFGYTTSVIAGFLLTAVANWTGRETAAGIPLGILAGLWVLGRIAMGAAAALPRPIVAAADLAFLPALIVALGRPLLAAKNRRNYPLLALVALLAASNVMFHLIAFGFFVEFHQRVLLVPIDVIVLLIAIVGGRVIPLFTRNATGRSGIRSSAVADGLAIGSVTGVVFGDAFFTNGQWLGPLLAASAIFTAVRAVRWGAMHTTHEPLLWVLHLGYAWIPIGLAFRAASVFAPSLNPFAALHALTVGAIGTLTAGMMARVSLGHTGRPLRASRTTRICFVLITLSAALRVAGPIVVPAWAFQAVQVSGLLWSVAFASFAVAHVSVLTRPRIDGKQD
jgi:uncharacterized protein involved in response to NO